MFSLDLFSKMGSCPFLNRSKLDVGLVVPTPRVAPKAFANASAFVRAIPDATRSGFKKAFLKPLLNKFFSLVLTCILLTSCALSELGTGEPAQLYLIDFNLPNPSSASGAPSATTEPREALLIANTTAPSYLSSSKLIFRRNPYTIESYKLAAWAEPAPARFTTLLLGYLETKDYFSSVNRSSVLGVGNILLNCEMFDLYHDATVSPGKAVLTVRCTSSRLKDSAFSASQTFTAAHELSTFDAAGYVQACSALFKEVIEEIGEWVSTL